MKAFAYREDGRIKFGNSVAPTAIQICSGHAKTVHDVVHAKADHGRFNLFVPGLNDSNRFHDVIEAITAFAIDCTQQIERIKAKGARRGA